MNSYNSPKPLSGRRLAGLVCVCVLHVLFFWAINSGLDRSFIKKIQGPVETVLLEEEKPIVTPPPPPPPPKNLPPPPPTFVPKVEVAVDVPEPPFAIAAVSNTPQPAAPPSNLPVSQNPSPPAPAAPPAPPVRSPAVVNSANCEKPEYPTASKRLQEEGTVSLKFLVGVDGKVLQSEIEKSSGFKRLDEAARAGLSKCAFKPATTDGKPEQAWANLKYVWSLD